MLSSSCRKSKGDSDIFCLKVSSSTSRTFKRNTVKIWCVSIISVTLKFFEKKGSDSFQLFLGSFRLHNCISAIHNWSYRCIVEQQKTMYRMYSTIYFTMFHAFVTQFVPFCRLFSPLLESFIAFTTALLISFEIQSLLFDFLFLPPLQICQRPQ